MSNFVVDARPKRKAEPVPAVIKPKRTKVATSTTNVAATVDLDVLDSPGAEWNLKITSWNVAGLRAVIKKDGMQFLLKENADIICLQVKCAQSV